MRTVKSFAREFKPGMKIAHRVLCFLILACSSAAVTFGQVSSSGSSTPDLSGFWQLKFDSENVPPASLTLSAVQADPEAQYRQNVYAIRWCNHIGMPAVMETSSPIDIRQGHAEIAIA